MLDLGFSKPAEIVKRLCERLRMERLAQEMTQADVAARAGIGTNTVSNLEAGRNVGFENLVRVAMVLGAWLVTPWIARLVVALAVCVLAYFMFVGR